MTDTESRDVQALIARVQRLAEAPRPEEGYPPRWQVEAFYLGDVSAVLTAALRAAEVR